MEQADLIADEFKSRYIELCSEASFVRQFIHVPQVVVKCGFHPYDTQDNISPVSNLSLTDDERNNTKTFTLNFDLRGRFFYFDPKYEGDDLTLRLTYFGSITEEGKIFKDGVKPRR